MNEIVLVVEDVKDFLELTVGKANCWYTVDFLDGEAILTILCESKSRVGGFVVYKIKRLVNGEILDNLEKYYDTDFGEGSFEDRAYRACTFIFSSFIEELRELGIKVRRGRYFIGLKPLF